MNCCRLRCLAEACSANPTTVSGTKFLGSTGHLPTAVELGKTRRTQRRVLPLLPRREERGGGGGRIFARGFHPVSPRGRGNTASRAPTGRGALECRKRSVQVS